MIEGTELKREWDSPESKQYFEWLQSEIARAYFELEWAIGRPVDGKVVDALRAEAWRVYDQCCHPVLVIKRGDDEQHSQD